MKISGWTVMFLSAICYVSCRPRPKSVFDSMMSPTFMQPNANQTKEDDFFGDFFDNTTSIASLARSASAAGDSIMKFNFSAVVPMSRSASSSTYVSSHTSTNSESVAGLPTKGGTQGVNVTKTVENVQVMMPKSASSATKEITISTNNPELFGFVGSFAEKDLHDRLATAKPLYQKGVMDILSTASVSSGQYFTIFPIQSSSPRTFYVISNTLPAAMLSKSLGKLLIHHSPGGAAEAKTQHSTSRERSSSHGGGHGHSHIRRNR